jgi:hypothetical protein
MNLFLITFFMLYGGMHLYAFLRTRAVFALGTASSISLILFMLLMTFAPLIVHISEKHGYVLFARFMSYIGYIWMGFLLIFFVYLLAIDIFRSLVYAVEFILGGNLHYLKLSARISFFIALILSVLILIYGYFEAMNIRTEKITIKTSKLPEEIKRLKILQISDVHIGLIVREERLKRILKEVKKADPDIVISTGDLVDGQLNNLIEMSRFFKEIKPKYGKYAITGNHEFYAGLDHSLTFLKEAGFTILRGEGLTIEDMINIIGIDDPAGKPHGLYKNVSEKNLLSRFSNGKFTLLLKHRPTINKESLGLFDLQLSGHTHKGQIFPFSFITMFYYPTQAGLSRLTESTLLYVNRGCGTWGPPIRFLSPPEITVIELVRDRTLS